MLADTSPRRKQTNNKVEERGQKLNLFFSFRFGMIRHGQAQLGHQAGDGGGTDHASRGVGGGEDDD